MVVENEVNKIGFWIIVRRLCDLKQKTQCSYYDKNIDSGWILRFKKHFIEENKNVMRYVEVSEEGRSYFKDKVKKSWRIKNLEFTCKGKHERDNVRVHCSWAKVIYLDDGITYPNDEDSLRAGRVYKATNRESNMIMVFKNISIAKATLVSLKVSIAHVWRVSNHRIWDSHFLILLFTRDK